MSLSSSDKKITPLMQQYWEIKNQHLDKILFFRMGDFFEIFFEDAKIAAPILNIALTQRNKKSEDETPMCGMPHHSVATPISKLLAAGYKVAICDQIEDPAIAKGIVKRAVTRVLTPGMVFDPESLDGGTANFVACADGKFLSLLDPSSGEAFYYAYDSEKDLYQLVQLLRPIEMLVQAGATRLALSVHFTEFALQSNDDYKKLPLSAQSLINYITVSLKGGRADFFAGFVERKLTKNFKMSALAFKHLEIFESLSGEKKHSLFAAMDRTQSSGGARLLKDWLRFPLVDLVVLNNRYESIDQWRNLPVELKEIRKIIASLGDVERRLGKIQQLNCNPRDLLSLADSLTAGLLLDQFCLRESDKNSESQILAKISADIQEAVREDAPVQLKNGGVIKANFSAQMAELTSYAEDSQQLLIDLELKEKTESGISSLKIRYNNVFGYYIEVTNTHKSKVPERYQRRQTLANAERYVTKELLELEEKILSAKVKRVELETRIFEDLREMVMQKSLVVQQAAKRWASVDVLSSLAWLSMERNFCRPLLTDSGEIKISQGRHPVIEKNFQRKFVPNSVTMPAGECILLTGPNMAGKSTLMRQVALIQIMAQMGSFVPATSAELPIIESIYTRIGANDNLSEGLSTFMVEMKETAELIFEANENSLVILDEIGRGTSTFDGLSLAQAILEYLVTKNKCRILFSTHYHEMISLASEYSQIKNFHMSVVEKKDQIDFQYLLSEGPASKSYGIQVAKLAGLPKPIIEKAHAILSRHERQDRQQLNLFADFGTQNLESAISSHENHLIIDELKKLNLSKITPLEALNKISQWQNEA